MRRREPGHVPARLEAAWRKKLAASGFDDLEGTDRDAPLSNRGKLHDAGADEDYGLPHRIESGEAYTEWAQGVDGELEGASRWKRKVWRRHARGESLKGIARDLGVSFHAARETVNAISRDFRCEAPSLARVIRRVDGRVLARLAVVLARSL